MELWNADLSVIITAAQLRWKKSFFEKVIEINNTFKWRIKWQTFCKCTISHTDNMSTIHRCIQYRERCTACHVCVIHMQTMLSKSMEYLGGCILYVWDTILHDKCTLYSNVYFRLLLELSNPLASSLSLCRWPSCLSTFHEASYSNIVRVALFPSTIFKRQFGTDINTFPLIVPNFFHSTVELS